VSSGRHRAPAPLRAAGYALSFVAGLVAGAVLVWRFEVAPPPTLASELGLPPVASLARGPSPAVTAFPPLGEAAEAPPGVAALDDSDQEIVPSPPPAEREVETAVGDTRPVDALAGLIARRLTVPVRGVGRDDLRDTFDERRGESRQHEAIDILAPRNTPVVAVEDGTVAKLFTSHGGGGLTVYQFDSDSEYAYYYAPLQRYAAGLSEGQPVRRGQVIGYVGTSGNAPPDTPHLHFAIYRLTGERQWWEGDPLNPFEILR
jgi:murein DD-endopeptidase MepM/ murein hydrolase activator NlpD